MGILVWIVGIILAIGFGLALWTVKLTKDAERKVPRIGKIHKVPGGAIHYLEAGKPGAPVLVMIPGLGATLQHYTYALADLLEDDFHLIMVDRPGCGYSERDSEDMAAVSNQARMIGALLDDLNLKAPTIVGHSLGGAVALAMALERPDKTGALALISPLTHDISDVPEALKGLIIHSSTKRRLIANTLAGPMGQMNTDAFLTPAFAPEKYPEDFVERSGHYLGLRPKGFIGASEDLVSAQTKIAEQEQRYASELTVPGGVIFGADDAVISAEQQGRAMTKFGLSYEALEGRGHAPLITAPLEVADFIRRMAGKVK